jgi:hydrogenase maturation protease
MKLVLFGYGNPGRGDDGLGPELVSRVEKMRLDDIECQNDMQLQIEHVADLDGCDQVLFVDADMSCDEPFEFCQIGAAKDDSYTSHAMSPTALLHAYRQAYGVDAPPAFLLRIRGYDFGLGEPLSDKASANLLEASKLVIGYFANSSPDIWLEHLLDT